MFVCFMLSPIKVRLQEKKDHVPNKAKTNINVFLYLNQPMSDAGATRTRLLPTSWMSRHDITRNPNSRLPGVAPPTMPIPRLRQRVCKNHILRP